MNLKEVTVEEETTELAGLKAIGIDPPTCWGDCGTCEKPAPFVFNFACEGVWCAEHFNQLLRSIN